MIEAVRRQRRAQMSPVWQALLELRQGPTHRERRLGFEPALPFAARPLSVDVGGATATVELARTTDLYGAAAIVYTLTAVDGIERVRIVVDGKQCCFPRMGGGSFDTAGRDHFRFWTGEPCELRTDPTHARCRRGP